MRPRHAPQDSAHSHSTRIADAAEATRAAGSTEAATTTDTAPATDAAPALDARGVHRRFGDVRAVDGVDLRIDRGDIVALLGPNGAGKTTFLDLVLGFSSPTSGTLSVLGGDPRRAVQSGSVGAVLQTGGLLDDLTVAETVRMIAACHARHLPVDEVLARAGITRIASRKVRRCSGGEQQRLRFALALLTEPDLLLLDEPTAGMDVRARAEFWAAMHAEAERGRTVVFATHYLQEAADFAGRIVLMRAGRVVVDGTLEEITGTRRRTLTCTWIAAEAPADFAARTGIADGEPRVSGSRATFSAQCTDALALAILSEGAGRDLEITPPSLDEVFLDLTEDTAEAPDGETARGRPTTPTTRASAGAPTRADTTTGA